MDKSGRTETAPQSYPTRREDELMSAGAIRGPDHLVVLQLLYNIDDCMTRRFFRFLSVIVSLTAVTVFA
jgi:hypothetical protein